MNVSGVTVSRNNTQTIVNVTSFRLLRIKCQEISPGTSKCHDHNSLTLHQPIRLQHFERGNENTLLKQCKSFNARFTAEWCILCKGNDSA